VAFFSQGLSLRQIEELTIEGNILLRDTDMDLCMGTPIDPAYAWSRWRTYLFNMVASQLADPDQAFQFFLSPTGHHQTLLRHLCQTSAAAIRDQYMAGIYRSTTINLSHLASILIMQCVGEGQQKIAKQCFYNTLYFSIKRLQQCEAVNLHRSLLNPEDYEKLLQGSGKRLENFMAMASRSDLLAEDHDAYRFTSRLIAEYDIDAIRMENLIAVYSNETAPVKQVRTIVAKTHQECDQFTKQEIARWCFDDEVLALRWNQAFYAEARYQQINAKETATADPTPFLRFPGLSNGVGALLVHGLLASPAELSDYGRYLTERGFTVLGVRLKGHGTSPHDLRQRDWEDWYFSVERGLSILSAFCEQIVLIGFSTGGALALLLAATQEPTITAVVAVSVPIKFRNPAFMLVPLLQAGNDLLAWGPSFAALKPFIENPSEHPNINYRHVPVRSLFELRRLIAKLQGSAARITRPVLLLQAEDDPVVLPESSVILLEQLGSADKQMHWISATRHGILMENAGGIWGTIDGFLGQYVPVRA
jgi:esterase/lipase